jgi:hypothetical protein
MFAGGDVTEYVVGWDAYAAARDRPWAKGARIQMLFEDMTRGVDPDAPGAMKQSGFEPAPGAAPNAEEKGEGPGPGPGPAEPAAGDAASPAGAGTTLGAASEASGKEEPEPEPGGKESKPGVLKAPNGAELFIGTVSRVKGGDDPWENTQVVFDSDPAQEEPMWVCPWEIELAPEEYQPKGDPEYRPFGGQGAEKSAIEEDPRSEADQRKVDSGVKIAERLGWPNGVPAARAEFQTWREAAYGGQRVPRAPTFCGSELDLYRVLVEAMCLGGYDLVTEEKRWKQIARTLGKDLTTQTSASFALRNYYQRCLLDFEKWLWDNAETLGPRPDSFDPQTKQTDAEEADGERGGEEGEEGAATSEEDSPGEKKPPPASTEEEEEEEEEDKEDKEGEEEFDPDAESDEGEPDDDSDDEDFAVGPASAGKRKRDDDDESD